MVREGKTGVGATWFRSQTVALTVIVDYACCVSFSLSFVQLTIAIACAGYNAVASARRQAGGWQVGEGGAGGQDEGRTRVASSFFVCLARRAAIQVQELLTGIANSRLASAADY